MNNDLYEKFVNTFSWLSYGLTCFLSVYAVTKIMNMPGWYWIIIAIIAGAVVNTGEMLSWYRYTRNNAEKILLKVKRNRAKSLDEEQEIDILYKKRDKWHPLAVCVFAASLSIAGTFFALQTGYDRGKQIDDIQTQIMKQLALSEGVITEYQLNNEAAREQAKIKKMLSNHYLTKGEKFLAKADSLLGSNAKELDYLKNNIENKIAIGVYNAYSELFGGNPQHWALIFNTILAVIIETIFLYLSYESYHINNPLPYIRELGEREQKKERKEPAQTPQTPQIELPFEPQVVHADSVQILALEEKKTPQIEVQKLTTEFAPGNGKESAKTQTGSKKKTLVSTFAPTAKKGANNKAKRKQNNEALHRKICFEFMQQKAQIKDGLREQFNYSEIASIAQTTRQNVDYHLRREHLKM
jgi:hypothetical protein